LLPSYFVPALESKEHVSGSFIYKFITVVAVMAVPLFWLSVYFYRENSRELRVSAQRVTFVNQVSHELKTPLTNIRMYAELLEKHLPEDNEQAAQHLDVIVSESQRLSRLIANVLTFARQQ